MKIIPLSPADLSIAAGLVVLLALLTLPMRLGLFRQMLVAALRTVVQLSLVGFVLKALFEHPRPGWIALMAGVMLLAAGREVMYRQKRRFTGFWGGGLGLLSLFVSSFSITVLALAVIIRIRPWYDPQYAVPLLGMMLGNTMTGIAIGLDRLFQSAWDGRQIIEARLMLGEPWFQAVAQIRKESIRSGLIPVINSMSVVGLVSLPGMMTGQILSGTLPVEAVKYQILVMFLIACGTGFGTILAVWLGARRLFDDRQRLRLDRLRET
jgi:putative ABC transport system permease protein